MASKKRSAGMVHTVSNDVRSALSRSPKAYKTWKDITPLAKNEWICWITSAKKAETRKRRIRVGLSKLTKGDPRPCCWAGCPHR